MKTVKETTSDSFRKRGSKFLGYLFRVDIKSAFEAKLKKLKNTYPDATHHCYAWRLQPAKIQEFAQDDGEPGGTAGLPILNQLKSCEVINAGIIVVRYYGGTKLGKSGLVQAYGQTAELCLQKANLQPIQLIWKVEITYPYAEQNTIEQLIHQLNLKELDSKYTAKVSLTLACPVKYREQLNRRLTDLEHRNITGSFMEKSFI